DLQPSPPTLSHRPPTTHHTAEQPARYLQLARGAVECGEGLVAERGHALVVAVEGQYRAQEQREHAGAQELLVRDRPVGGEEVVVVRQQRPDEWHVDRGV